MCTELDAAIREIAYVIGSIIVVMIALFVAAHFAERR
jgi:hypothetical protein